MKKTVLITGATSGIGEAIAFRFAKENSNLILTGRRTDRLKDLKQRLEEEYKINVLTLNFDVRELEQVEKAIDSLPEDWNVIDVLINNAGLAVGLNTFQEGVIDDWERMIDTNVKGLLYVSKKIAPLMIARNQGHIINIGSIAGKQNYPKGNVYCASKHAVDSLSASMRVDLLPHNIRVTQIRPGAVETEFSLVRFKGDRDTADNVYKGYQPLVADDIAEVTYYATSLPAHVNINDLEITPTAQANAYVMHKQL
ncbi:MAG: SDR family oxidoreductase [Bacteroidales bacterium]|nr:SDR family oxidoreductase [Bacteroidales bacterium]